jgi:hypothetical protein
MLTYERNIETLNKNSEMSKLSNQTISQTENKLINQKTSMFNQLIKQRIIQAAFKKEGLNIGLLA